jgi:hypothetical protein
MQPAAQLMWQCFVVMCQLQFAHARPLLTVLHGNTAGSFSQTMHEDTVLASAAGGRARDQASNGAQAEAAAIWEGAKDTQAMRLPASSMVCHLARLNRVGTRVCQEFVGGP